MKLDWIAEQLNMGTRAGACRLAGVARKCLELKFPDLTIIRLGSNALFRFIAGEREMILHGGTMLFSSPKGAGGGKVQAGSVTVKGSDFLVSEIAGRVKVISRSDEVLVYFTANPEIRVVLQPGQKLDIAPGATKMPPVISNPRRIISGSLEDM